MYIGDLRNSRFNYESGLSESTLNQLSDIVFNRNIFDKKIQFEGLGFEDNYFQTSVADLSYFEEFGFKQTNESHLFIQLDRVIKTHNSLIENWTKFIKKPDIVLTRERDGFIEEISFYKGREDQLYLASKSRYFPSGKFFRDSSNSAFIFSHMNYINSLQKPYYSLKFNSKNVSIYFHPNSKNKWDQKTKTHVNYLDCVMRKKFYNSTEISYEIFGIPVLLSTIKNIFPDFYINNLNDLFSSFSDDQISLLKLMIY